jgi:hypothetical protein
MAEAIENNDPTLTSNNPPNNIKIPHIMVRIVIIVTPPGISNLFSAVR